MTINEKKQLSEYIKGLVRESINEMPLPDPDETGLVDAEGDEEENSGGDIAGLNELRQLAESMAREAVASILAEKKGAGWKNKGGKKSRKSSSSKKKSSSEKTLMDRLNSNGVNAAHYYYKLYGAKSDAEKAAARSLGYKKAKGEKTPDKKSNYRFTPKERNKLNAMLAIDNN